MDRSVKLEVQTVAHVPFIAVRVPGSPIGRDFNVVWREVERSLKQSGKALFFPEE
jgi:hypothetical protein